MRSPLLVRGWASKRLRENTQGGVAEKLAKTLVAEEEPRRGFMAVDITLSEFLAQYEDAVRGTMKRRSFETYLDIARLHLLPPLETRRLRT